MKPFLGIDLTIDKKNTQLNGKEFLIAKTSSALTQSFERSSDQAMETIEKSELPLLLRILQAICGFIALIMFFGTINAFIRSDTSPVQAYHNVPWLYWVGGACLVVWLVLKLFSRKKEKTVLEDEENARVFSSLESVSNSIYTELSVPADATEVDILTFFYKEKGEQIKVCEKGMQIAPYLNPIFKVFSDAEYLYLADLEGKYAFPLSSIRAIRTIKKHIRIMEWNKETRFDDGIYKQYKLTSDNYGCIHCKHYHILEVSHNDETWGIYIPCYELPVFEKLTGLKAQQD